MIATGLGFQQLVIGKVFGTVPDYLFAIAWGFGIDQTVRGAAAVFGKVRGETTP